MRLFAFALAYELTELINLSLSSECCGFSVSYRTALGYALCSALQVQSHDDHTYNEEFSQWTLARRMRNRIAYFENNSIEVLSITSNDVENSVTIFVRIYDEHDAHQDQIITIGLIHFNALLWTFNANCRRMLNSQNDAQAILCMLLNAGNQLANSYHQEIPQSVDNQPVQMERAEKLQVFYQCVYLPLFNSHFTEWPKEKQAQVATVLGAALFYLPHPVGMCWTGLISEAAIANKLRGDRIVKDHIIPRKRAADELLNREGPMTFPEFEENFTNRYSAFAYLTPSENSAMRNYEGEYCQAALANEINLIKLPCEHRNLNTYLANHGN